MILARGHAFGLNIASEIAIAVSGASEAACGADIRISQGKVPASLPHPVVSTICCDVAEDRILLRLHGLARVLVRGGGREIVVEAARDADEDGIGLMLTGAALPAALRQRGGLVLAATAVASPNGAMLLLGWPGVGKSSLAATLASRGQAAVLADDVCGVEVTGERPSASAGYPWLDLWGGALSGLPLSESDLRPVRNGIGRYRMPVIRNDFAARPIASICIIESAQGGGLDFRAVRGLDIAHALVHATRWSRFQVFDPTRVDLGRLLKIAGRVPVYRLRRPPGADVDDLADRLQAAGVL